MDVYVSVAIDSEVALECDVLPANPPPQIRWRRDGSTIVEIGRGYNNTVLFLDGGRYLYMSRLTSADLASTYRCEVTNAFLDRTVMAPTTYRLIDNLTRGDLVDYKQIGDLTAFVGNTSFEIAYVGGIFGFMGLNFTINVLFQGSTVIPSIENIGYISNVNTVGIFNLTARVRFYFGTTDRFGTLTVHRKI